MNQALIPAILRIARLHRTRRATALAGIGLHPGQDTVLLLIERSGASTMTEIARALSVQPPTVTKIVGRLVANGFVARHEVRGDMRKSAIDLTEVGREKVTQVKAIWAELESLALAAVSAGRDVAGVLELIEANLTRCASRSGEVL